MIRYPIYVISKGRSDICLTARILKGESIPFKLVVEEPEADAYRAEFGEAVTVLPFVDLGAIPARNWCWQDALDAGHERHWMLDDNLRGIYRWHQGRRLPAPADLALGSAEQFTDRYTNIGISGLNYVMFGTGHQPPFLLNKHVYSCMLIRNDIEYRWRGTYNADTDLCLQVLSGGLCTVLINAFLVQKIRTMNMKGGNTARYQGDGRLKMARSLERQWPGIVEVKRRFERPQHVINDQWRGFDTQLIRRTDIDWEAIEGQQHNLTLRRTREPVGKRTPKL